MYRTPTQLMALNILAGPTANDGWVKRDVLTRLTINHMTLYALSRRRLIDGWSEGQTAFKINAEGLAALKEFLDGPTTPA